MKTRNVPAIIDLAEEVTMTSTDERNLWDAILFYALALAELRTANERRDLITSITESGAPLSFPTLVWHKAQLDSAIMGANNQLTILHDRLQDTCANVGIADKFSQIVKLIEEK